MCSYLPFSFCTLLFPINNTITPITVNSPNSRSGWQIYWTRTISWSSSKAVKNVKIELYRSGARVETIASSTSNDGSFSWTIPKSLDVKNYSLKNINKLNFKDGCATLSMLTVETICSAIKKIDKEALELMNNSDAMSNYIKTGHEW